MRDCYTIEQIHLALTVQLQPIDGPSIKTKPMIEVSCRCNHRIMSPGIIYTNDLLVIMLCVCCAPCIAKPMSSQPVQSAILRPTPTLPANRYGIPQFTQAKKYARNSKCAVFRFPSWRRAYAVVQLRKCHKQRGQR